jgi:hypothetical protein
MIEYVTVSEYFVEKRNKITAVKNKTIINVLLIIYEKETQQVQ